MHARVGGEGWEVGGEDAGVAFGVVVLVLGEHGPHASVDAVAGAGDEAGGSVGCWVYGREDELGRGHLL